MLEGLMQHDHPLTLQHILDRMRGLTRRRGGHAHRGRDERATYGEVAERVDRLCRALQALGVGAGDRVATFAWNSQEHLEVYLAAPCMGAVLHTLNIRLFPEQLTYIVNHAQDKVIFVDALARRRARASTSTSSRPSSTTSSWATATASAAERAPLRGAARRARSPASTTPSSTSGRRPGSATRAARPATRRASCTRTARTSCTRWGSAWPTRSASARADRVLPVVPMFHANAWGLPYAACWRAPTWSCPAASSRPSRWRS